MEVLTENRNHKHPFIQALVLLLGAVLGMIVFVLLGFLVLALVYGPELIFKQDWMLAGPNANVGAIKILLTAQQLGLFLTPAVVLAFYERHRLSKYYGLIKPNLQLLLYTLVFMLLAMPAFSAINMLNQEMTLPKFLKGLEEWMKAKEEEAMATTKLILTMKNWGDYLVGILVIGIIPAICEEFLFRGALQKIFGQMVKNIHFQVWLAATIFSVIHLQFYGFFPRLFLGAAFGYLYVWSGNIWYAILAHFVNNAFAVSISFYYQSKGFDFDKEPSSEFSFIPVLITMVVAIWFFYKFYKSCELKPETPNNF